MVHVFVCGGKTASGSLASFHANLHSRARLISTRGRLLSEGQSKHYDTAIIGQVSPGFFLIFSPMSFNSIKSLTRAVLITYSFAFLFFFFYLPS